MSLDFPRADIAAAVAAGGKSSRFGRDKAQEIYLGSSLLEKSIRTASKVCAQVLVSGRDPAPLGLSLPWLPDITPGQGPIGGLVTILEAVNKPVLLLACDSPRLTPSLLMTLIRERDRKLDCGKLCTVYQHSDTGYVEMLAALYEPASLPLLRTALAENRRSLQRALPQEVRLHLPAPDLRSFININTQSDLAALLAEEAKDAPAS